MEENKIIKDINNLEKSFNLENLQKLLNVSLQNFNNGKKSQENNQKELSLEEFNVSLDILNNLNNICHQNKCNQNIQNQIKNAIQIVEQYKNNEKIISDSKIGGNIETENIVKSTEEIKSQQQDLEEIQSITEKKQETILEKDTNLFYLINEKYRNLFYENFIQPLNYPELYKKNFNSVLLYGYRGNGKSFIAHQSLKQINNENYIKKIIDMKSIINEKIIINEIFEEINEIIENNHNYKLIILIEDIELLEDKKISNYFYDYIYRYSQKENIYILATSNEPWLLDNKIIDIFEKKICVQFPQIEDINLYFIYQIYQYINFNSEIHFDYQKIIELLKNYEKFNIPIFKDIKDIYKISKKCYDKKCSYYDLNIIINQLFNVGASSAINNNIFQKKYVDGIYFINSLSIYSRDYDINNIYLFNPPEYKYITDENIKYISYNYSPNPYAFDDERIINYYIEEKETNNDEISIIGEIDIGVTNNINEYTNNNNIIAINKIILEIYLQLFKNIIYNCTNIVTKNKVVYRDLHNILIDNIDNIGKINDLNDLLYSKPEVTDKIINLFEKSYIINSYQEFKNTYGKCLNTLIQTITIEKKDYKYNIIYQNKNSQNIENYKEGISSEMNNPDEFKEIITSLLSEDREQIIINGVKCEIQICYLNNDYQYSWTIEIIPDYQSNNKINIDLFDIEIINKKINYDVSPSVDLTFNLINLDYSYKITNECDVSLLQEVFPEDYQEIYKDEIETWLMSKIKKNKHFEYLQNTYNGYQKFFLNLYYYLLDYKKNCFENLNPDTQKKLTILINNIQVIIEKTLLISQDYDESVEEKKENWKLSSNYLENNYSINLLIMKQLFEISTQFNSMREIMNFYGKVVNGIFKTKNEKIFIKTKINKHNINGFFYSSYLNDNSLMKNNKFNKLYFDILNNKIMQHKSFFFEIIRFSEKIGYLEEDNIKWFTYDEKINTPLKNFLKSGMFAISNRTTDFIQNVFTSTCNQEIINNTSAYIISSMYSNEYKIDNIIKIYLGIILYNKKLILNIDNNDFNDNILTIIENNIIKNFNHIKDNFSSLKYTIKNISIPDLPTFNKIFNSINKISNIEENEYYYKSKYKTNEENIKREKLYSDYIQKKFDYDIQTINSSLKNLNLKKEYLEEIVDNYQPSFNIENINLIEEYNL